MIEFPKSLKIDGVCAVKDVRYYLNEVHYNAAAKELVATDGHKLAVIPLPHSSGVTGSIPVDAIKEARKTVNTQGKPDSEINLDGEHAVLNNGAGFQRDLDSKYPDYERILPDPDRTEVSIIINPDYLKQLADALIVKGEDRSITLHMDFDAKTQQVTTAAIRVTVDNSPNHGVLMPIRPPAKES
jgi:DNA polymerase III sliding clamp (beta) subunit (PCNA family)